MAWRRAHESLKVEKVSQMQTGREIMMEEGLERSNFADVEDGEQVP